ncbi:MAG: ATP-dependent RNA helicase [Clostridia bacterium]|jgi:HrpA-like RNA helicase|nr:ATP-dependent RNA helicase [Clostridia bacterium]
MNKTLPIFGYKEEIVKAVKEHAVTIITAETGSGKSTQVPQYLSELGYNVVVTEPRRMAAWSLAERVAEEMNSPLGETVGFRTGFERNDSEKTSILYCTDGLELVRQITDTKNKQKVLIIDEVHEWNLNIETLVAWSKKKISEGWYTKVVIMSATLEKEALARYFGKDVYALEVPGKVFPVSFEQRDEYRLISTICEMVQKGRNTLVFVPGKKEIAKVMEDLSHSDIKAVVLPLHGELDSVEQKKCFLNYAMPKVIVATNVAQTSITIPDISAVVDTGTERRVEVINRVEGLFVRDISKADCMQRKGRAGRTMEGEYILCSNTPFEDREEFSTPEIQRGILDQIVLRLATIGIDATELEFFHQPSIETLLNAKETLIGLGALTKNNEVTPIGYKMAKMTVSVKAARMVIEAEKYGVTEDVICIAAIHEIGSLLNHRKEEGFHLASYYEFTDEDSSDYIAELNVLKKLKEMEYINFKQLGINRKAYNHINEYIQKLQDSLKGVMEISSSGNRKSIRKCCIAGMVDHVYIKNYEGYVNCDGITRNLDKNSCLNGWDRPKLLVGTPKIIEIKNPMWGGKKLINLVNMATKVTIEDLKEVAPQLLTQKDIDTYYSCYSDVVKVTRNTYFKNTLIESREVSVPNHPDYEKLKEEYEEKQKAQKEYKEQNRYYETQREQEYVTIDGKEFRVSQGYREASISIDKYTLYHTDVRTVSLDNGTKVTIYYSENVWNAKRNANILALRNAVENDRLKTVWKEAKSNVPKLKSVSIPSVMQCVDTLGKKEVTCGNGGYGDPIYGFGCLVLEGNSMHFDLLEDEEEANNKTQEAIEFLYGRFIREHFSDKKFKFRKGIKGLSPKEQKVKAEFDSEVHELARGLDISNIEERLSYLEELYSMLIEDLKIVA